MLTTESAQLKSKHPFSDHLPGTSVNAITKWSSVCNDKTVVDRSVYEFSDTESDHQESTLLCSDNTQHYNLTVDVLSTDNPESSSESDCNSSCHYTDEEVKL